ncbi:MAG: alpha-xylosidase [Calditrichia bacterium]
MKLPPRNAPPGFDWIVRLSDFKIEKNHLQVKALSAQGREARLTICVLANGIWNYTFFPPGSREKKLTAVIQNRLPLHTLNLKESDGQIHVAGGEWHLIIESDPWRMKCVNKTGAVVWKENISDVDGLGRLFTLPLGFVESGGEISAVTQSFHLRPDEHLYGLGEKFTRLDKAGQKIVTWTQDALGSTSERSHKNIPFLISTRGYGFFLNSSARISWDLGVTSTQSCIIFQEDEPLDVFLIPGHNPADILYRYCQLTGFSPLPPKWSFGLWISSGGTYRDRETIEKLIGGLETHGVAADVVHVDPWWMRWRKYCDFQWNEEAFPNANEFIETVHQNGLKLCLWIQPYISVESELFEYGKNHDLFVKRPNGEVYIIDYGLSLAPRPDGIIRTANGSEGWNAPVAIIDLTNPAAYRWFQDLMRPVLRQGVDVFKTDFGEDIPEDAVFSNGESGRTLHNLYPLLYNRAVFEVTRQEKGYGLVWARSAFSGSQKFPLCWSGDPAADWESLAATIRGGLSLGMSGIPFWSHDIGGYRGTPSAELYIRWAQFGLLCSHSRMHGDSPREPWAFGEKALKIVRKYIDLRYRLFPYLYSTAKQACRTGLPVIRAMPLAFPDDPNSHHQELQFMLGEWLLVAPIYDPGNSRFVYLPPGEWIDYFDHTEFTGPGMIKVTAPLEKLPLFVRRGAILPLAPNGYRISENRTDPLILEIFPAEKSHYILAEDEGDTEIVCMAAGTRIRLDILGPVDRKYLIRLNSKEEIKHIEVRRNDHVFDFSKENIKQTVTGVEIEIPFNPPLRRTK